MPNDDVWAVDYIMKAECKLRKDGKLTWIYVVKWRNYGHFSSLPLPGSDPLFERDPSLLEGFWGSTPFSPDNMHEGTVIIPHISYKEQRRAMTAAALIDDSSSAKNIPAKRRRSSSPSIKLLSPSPSSETSGLQNIGSRIVVVSDHSDESDCLPDYEDNEDVEMILADNPSVQHQSEDIIMRDDDLKDLPSDIAPCQYGPPELGIDDDDLYVPHPTPVSARQESSPHDETVRSPSLQNEFLNSPHPSVSTLRQESISSSGNPSKPLPDPTHEPQMESHSLQGSAASSLQAIDTGSSVVVEPARPSLGLAIVSKLVLPLTVQDMSPPDMSLGKSSPCLEVHGYYHHEDIKSEIHKWREGNSCDTAKLILEKGAVTAERRNHWKKLHEYLRDNNMCLITFLPQAPHALIVFSSQSMEFGKAMGAHKRQMGFVGSIVACRVMYTVRRRNSEYSGLCIRRRKGNLQPIVNCRERL